jgi:hypothetical protein
LGILEKGGIILSLLLAGKEIRKFDQVNRMAIPPSFRKELGETVIIMKSIHKEPCLILFSEEEWANFSYGVISAFSGESTDPDAVYKAICDEVVRLQKEGFPKENFERAKRVCYGRAVSLFDRQESFSNAFCRFATKDADLLTYPSFVNKVTFEDIEECLKRLNPDKCVLSAIYPKKED